MTGCSPFIGMGFGPASARAFPSFSICTHKYGTFRYSQLSRCHSWLFCCYSHERKCFRQSELTWAKDMQWESSSTLATFRDRLCSLRLGNITPSEIKTGDKHRRLTTEGQGKRGLSVTWWRAAAQRRQGSQQELWVLHLWAALRRRSKSRKMLEVLQPNVHLWIWRHKDKFNTHTLASQ